MGGGGGREGQHRAARGWTVQGRDARVYRPESGRTSARAGGGDRGNRRHAPRGSASSGANLNLRANVASRGRWAGRARAVGSPGFETSVRASRVTDRDPAWKRGRIRARGGPFSIPIERGGIPSRAVRAGTRGLMRFPTKRRVSPRAVLRSPSLTLNIFSLLVSPDPPAGASPRLDARTTAARRARRRDEPRARFSLGRHPCRPDRGARAARGEHATRPLALAVVVAVDVIVVVVVAAEHADPLSPVCLAPRAVRRTGAVVVGGRSRPLSRQPPPGSTHRGSKKHNARAASQSDSRKNARPMTWQLLAADFWRFLAQFFGLATRKKPPVVRSPKWSEDFLPAGI